MMMSYASAAAAPPSPPPPPPSPQKGTGGAAAADASESSAADPYLSQEYQDAMEDVHTRFILNLPDSELDSPVRVLFQIEQAWWYYEDWICDPNPELPMPRFKNFKVFARQMYLYSPLLPEADEFNRNWGEWIRYKLNISNYGCILLNQDCTKLVLCQVWNGDTHTLPAGKINQGEDGKVAAARETYEETGFDPLCENGLTATWKATDPDKVTWNPHFADRDQIAIKEDSGKRRVCYVCVGVPEDFPFEPVCRKEVSVVAWHDVDNIPSKSFGVIPFLSHIRRYIKKKKGKSKSNKRGGGRTTSNKRGKADQTPNKSRGNNNSRGRNGSRGRTGSRGRKVRDSDDLVQSGLASAGDPSGWSEEDMFQTNEKMIGRKVDYDGNPHVFAEEGFGGKDPHSFHIVGGTFLNSDGGVRSLAGPPETSKLQPLFRREGENSAGEADDDDVKLTPFFAADGATPWGAVEGENIQHANTAVDTPAEDGPALQPFFGTDGSTPWGGADPENKQQHSSTKEAEQALLGMLQSKSPTPAARKKTTSSGEKEYVVTNDVFMTDAEITAKSQADKKGSESRPMDDEEDAKSQARRLQYEKDTEYIRQWVADLPKPAPTKYFGEFKLDADAIMAKALASLPVPEHVSIG